MPSCKECARAQSAKRRRDKPEECKKAGDKWRKENPEKARKWYTKNPEAARKKASDKYWADPEKAREKSRMRNVKNPNATRRVRKRSKIKAAYGLTLEDYERLISAQTACDICGATGGRKNLDHDHKTGVLRGVLCTRCNLSLGASKDSIGLLEKMIAYLKNPPFGTLTIRRFVAS